MNERIKELAKQAGFVLWADEEWKPDGAVIDWSSDYDNDLEKFAELIIQECLEVVEKQIGGGNGDGVEWDRAVDFTYNDIKSYFGVEE
jgi:hypothetical protein